jgi:putative endonuclease
MEKGLYMGRQYYVYIMTNKSGTLYTGMTNNLRKRVRQHKTKTADSFTKRYNITRLVYYEVFNATTDAIRAEKKIKGWLRKKKLGLIESKNPQWKNLAENW